MEKVIDEHATQTPSFNRAQKPHCQRQMSKERPRRLAQGFSIVHGCCARPKAKPALAASLKTRG